MSCGRFCPGSRRSLRLFPLAVVLGSAIFGGCGKTERLGIQGAVSLDGKPLEKGNITFRPLAGTASPSAGAQIVDGKFSIARERGLLPGKFRVEITASHPTDRKVRDRMTGATVTAIDQYLPARYNEQSQLEASVASNGANRFEFALTSK